MVKPARLRGDMVAQVRMHAHGNRLSRSSGPRAGATPRQIRRGGEGAGRAMAQTQPVGLGRPPHLQMSFMGPFLKIA